MIDLVDEAHQKVIEEFEVVKIWNALRKQAYLKKLPPILFNKSIPIEL